MTTIQHLQEIINIVRSLPDNSEKRAYLEHQDRTILNFLSGNIKKDGVAKAIASEISTSKDTKFQMEDIINTFEIATKSSRRKDKINLMKSIGLTLEDKNFVLTCLFGSLKLGLKIPIPDPIFGETIKPQLCGTGIEFDPKKYIIEEKFDGIRCIATNNNGEIILQSRNGKILDVPVIKQSLAESIPPGTTIDGEIIASDGQFESLSRKSNNLIYMVFDVIFTEGIKVQMPLYHRLIILDHEVYENEHVKISQSLNLNSVEKIDNWIVKTGAEGIVAKDPNSLYQYGDRKEWIKYKLFKECTAEVQSYNLGEGKRKGTIGSINIIPENSNVITKCGSGFEDKDLDYMKNLINNNNNILVNIKFQNYTNAGCLRFPIFMNIRSINGKESLE